MINDAHCHFFSSRFFATLGSQTMPPCPATPPSRSPNVVQQLAHHSNPAVRQAVQEERQRISEPGGTRDAANAIGDTP